MKCFHVLLLFATITFISSCQSKSVQLQATPLAKLINTIKLIEPHTPKNVVDNLFKARHPKIKIDLIAWSNPPEIEHGHAFSYKVDEQSIVYVAYISKPNANGSYTYIVDPSMLTQYP